MFLDRFCFLSLLEFQKSFNWFLGTKLLSECVRGKKKNPQNLRVSCYIKMKGWGLV
jgi:hypothetical protein